MATAKLFIQFLWRICLLGASVAVIVGTADALATATHGLTVSQFISTFKFFAVAGAAGALVGFFLMPIALVFALKPLLFNLNSGGRWVCEFGGAGSGIAGAITDEYGLASLTLPGIVYLIVLLIPAFHSRAKSEVVIAGLLENTVLKRAFWWALAVSAIYAATYRIPILMSHAIDCS